MLRRIVMMGLVCALALAAPAADWVLVVDVAQKAVISSNVVAVREAVPLDVRNIGAHNPTNLYLLLQDSTNGPLAVCTNLYASGTNAAGMIDLNTTQMVALFSNMSAQASRTVTLTLWDRGYNRLLVNDRVMVLNNPFSSAIPAPLDLGTVATLAGLIAAAQADATAALAGVQTVSNMTVAASNLAAIASAGVLTVSNMTVAASNLAANAAAGVLTVSNMVLVASNEAACVWLSGRLAPETLAAGATSSVVYLCGGTAPPTATNLVAVGYQVGAYCPTNSLTNLVVAVGRADFAGRGYGWSDLCRVDLSDGLVDGSTATSVVATGEAAVAPDTAAVAPGSGAWSSGPLMLAATVRNQSAGTITNVGGVIRVKVSP